MIDLVRLPKAELHIHIEGTLEPEMIFAMAARNGVDLAFTSVDALRAAYSFTDLESFLRLYYQGMAVLQKTQDYYDLTAAYLERAPARKAFVTRRSSSIRKRTSTAVSRSRP